MTRPDPRQAAQTADLNAALSRAVDLSALKARAEAAGSAPPAGRQAAGADGGGPPNGGGGNGGSGNGSVVDVTEATFNSDVVERSMTVPVIVDLWATWCGPCKQLSPVLEKLAAAADGAWVLAKIDVDENPRIAQMFGVQSVPMVVAVAGGQPVDAFAGAQPEPQIRSWVDSLLEALRPQMPGIAEAEARTGAPAEVEEPEDPRVTEAEEALDRGDYSAAEAAYQRILDAEPANADAKAAIAQVRLLARTDAADPAAIERADAAPDDVDAQLAAADAELAANEVEAAFRRLVEAVRRGIGDDRDRVRRHLVELFELFPDGDDRVAAARRSLAAALY